MKQRRSLILVTVVLALLLLALPAMAGSPARQGGDHCRRHVSIERWNTQRQIEAQGFNFFVADTGESAFVGDTLRLTVAPDLDGDYSSSRINEVDTDAPVEERVKCWQPGEAQRIEAEYRIRWQSAAVPESLTELAFLGNAAAIDFNPQATFTAVGVARTSMLGGYVALVAQGVYADTQGFLQGDLNTTALSEIDPTSWHTVRLTLWQQQARVEVEQGDTLVVLEERVSVPFETLGAEFSIDNELLPGLYLPIQEGDTLEVDYYRISAVHD